MDLHKRSNSHRDVSPVQVKIFQENLQVRTAGIDHNLIADDAGIQLDQLLRKLGAYVESIPDTDETIIASAGMQTKASRTTPSTVVALEALSAAAGNHEGEIDLSWRKSTVRRAAVGSLAKRLE